MRKASSTVTFISSPKTIWNIITDTSNYAWRSDWRKVMGSEDPNQFTVYSRDGNNSLFTILRAEPYHYYEFTMTSSCMTGHWTGELEELPDGGARMKISETLKFTNPFLGLFSYLFLNLKKSQKTYIYDLKKKLNEIPSEL